MAIWKALTVIMVMGVGSWVFFNHLRISSNPLLDSVFPKHNFGNLRFVHKGLMDYRLFISLRK